jgi:hypothetical protein
MHTRVTGPLDDTALAAMAIAGLRILSQSVVTATAGASTSYTVTDKNCRRVVCLHTGTGAGDIRINFNAAATATHMPMLPQRYFVVEACINGDGTAETVRFWNTTVSSISVNVMEVC